MKLTTSLIFLIVLIASGSGIETTTAESTTSAQTTTVIDTTHVSTTHEPDTTTASPTTADLSTTSSTESPTTTTGLTPTIKPTTTSLPDTTTSLKPTTVPPITTTEAPTPVDGSWNVTEGNLTCIRADLKVIFKIYIKDVLDYKMVLSPNATSSGSCKLSDTTQKMQLQDLEYTLSMIFEKDSNKAYLKNITLNFDLPDSSSIAVYNDTKLFSVKVGNSYECSSLDVITFENVTMEIFHIRLQSFGSVGEEGFGVAEECEADDKVNEMVPIAVGIALMVLVVIVLVAYFVGRRRSRQKGYQSV